MLFRSVCRAAGVSTPLLQHYFGSKRRFFVAVVTEAVGELTKATRPAKPGKGLIHLDENLFAFFTFMREHPSAAAIVRGDFGSGDAEVQELFQAYRDVTFDLVVFSLGVESASPELNAAIRCWIGINETLVHQLLENAALSIDWATKFSRRSLVAMVDHVAVTTTV